MTLTVATFHVPSHRFAIEPHRYGGIRVPHTDLIPLFVSAIRRSSPQARLVLLSCDASIGTANLFDVVLNFQIDEDHLMLERLRCQRALRAMTNGSIAFLDTDVLVFRPLEEVFRMNFDLAITVRDEPRHSREIHMPYNNGVWFLKGEKRADELGYFDHLIATNEAMPEDAYAWGGNQLAVVQSFGRREAWDRFSKFGLDVLVLPCTQFNHAPNSPDDVWENRHIMHFHGSYKNLMRRYADLAGIELPD